MKTSNASPTPPSLPVSAPAITNYWVVPGYDTNNGDAFRCWCYDKDGKPATPPMNCNTVQYPTDFLSLSFSPTPWIHPDGAKQGDFAFSLIGAFAHTLSQENVLGQFYAPTSLPSGTSAPPTTQVVLPVMPGTLCRGVILMFTGKDAATRKTLTLLASKDPEIKNSTGGSDGG